MASGFMRRGALTAALAAVVASGAPLLQHADAASPAPSFQASASTPVPNGAVLTGGEKITASFSQPVTGGSSAMQVFEVNANGSRGDRLPGTVAFSPNPVTGAAGSTVSWTPAFSLVVAEYEAVVNVTGVGSDGKTADPTRPASADYDYYVVGTHAPSGLHAPAVNNQNQKAVPFSGTAAPDLTVTVSVTEGSLPATTGSAKVPACGSPACAFTVPVDVSNYPDGNLSWTAQGAESESTTKTAVSATQTVAKKATAPNAPSLTGAPTISGDSLTVTVPGATDSSSGLAGYVITINDQDGNSVTQNQPVNSDGSMGGAPVHVGVADLDDGTLTVLVQVTDTFGNISSSATSDPVGDHYTVTKRAGLLPNLGASTLATPTGDVTLEAAESRPVRTPSTIDVEFTQAIKLSYSNNNPPPATHNAAACLTSADGNCIVPISNITLSPTGRGLLLPVPANSLNPNGTYSLSVTAFSKNNCPDVAPAQTDSCEKFSDLVKVAPGNTGSLWRLQLDNTAPTISFTHVDSPITAGNLQAAAISGTVDSDVQQLQFSFTSSTAPNRPRIATVNTSPGSGNATFSLSPLPLSGVLDGDLTIAASAVDAAGNPASAATTAVLDALNLNSLSGDGKAFIAWSRPTLPGGAAPVYTLTYRDQSVANSPAHSVSVPSTSTSTVLGGLTNGDSYGVTLTATDSVGNGPAAVTTVTPKAAPALSLSAPTRLTYGTTLTLRGRLTHGGVAVAGKRITIVPTVNGKTAAALHATTDSTGTYSVRVKPLKTVTYRATFGGDGAYNPASSVARRVGIRVAIKVAKVASSTRSHTSAVTLSGSVAPNMRGRTVTIYEVVRGHNHKIGAIHLSTKSVWSFTHKWARGTHVVFANFLTQNGYYGNNSGKVKFTRS